FYSGLGGIKQQEDDVGFKKILIEPAIIDGLDWVNVSYQSINGEITVHWRKENGKTNVKISIPANTEAQLMLPVSREIYEGNKVIESNKSIRNMGEINGKRLLETPSGDYEFTLIK
ncbi:MAG: alpha-L-rhamnosidase C-terminal domain-containing protein, partial [Sphingobacterium sp.]